MPSRLPPFYLRLRFATAAIATWLMNLKPLGLTRILGVPAKSVCAPGFNCHGCAWATAACPVGVIAYGSAMHALPVLAIAFVLAVGGLVGRLICAFGCPFGLLQDLLHRIPAPKTRLPKFFRYGKYLALLLLVLALPYWLGLRPSGYLKVEKPALNRAPGAQLDVAVTVTNLGTEPVVGPKVRLSYRAHPDAEPFEPFSEEHTFDQIAVPPGEKVTLPPITVPNYLRMADLEASSPQSEVVQRARYDLYYCNLCPNGTLTAALPKALAAPNWPQRLRANALRLGILGGFLALMVISSRPFCRLFCPLGAMYALTSRLALLRIGINHAACIQCGQCDKACPLDLDVRKEIGGPECIACGDCKKVCPGNGIQRSFGLSDPAPQPEPQRAAAG